MVPPYSDRITRVPPYLSQAQYHTSLFAYRTITCYGHPFQNVLLRVVLSLAGSSDFARHYFRNLGWCLFLKVLRCFSSPGSLRIAMYSLCDTLAGEFPHSEVSGSKLICQLPEAYRRLSRPSSPIIAKASTMCSYSLDPITLTSVARHRSFIKECMSGLSPDALCRIQFNLNNSNFKREVWYSFWRNQNLLLTTDQGTVRTKPLRMCAFPNQPCVSNLIKLYKLLKNSRLAFLPGCWFKDLNQHQNHLNISQEIQKLFWYWI